MSYKTTMLYKITWWAQMGLNHRPHAYQAGALTLSLIHI